jgi:CubicO group peptidase (beta-lactamase class C family)
MLKAIVCAALALVSGVALAQSGPDRASALTPAKTSTAAQPTTAPPPVAASARPLTKADADIWLDGYMPYAMRTGDIPGAVVAIVKDGQILTSRGFGYADVARRIRVDPDRTLFRPGSVSKLFTWTAVMQLVEQRRLDLDADVNRYLDFRIPPYEGKPITLRQIMTHTAGFQEAAKDTVFFDKQRQVPLGTFLKRWVPERIYAPGTTPAYSNWATALAGYVVERASGMSFDDYVDQRIFAPLGMRNSTFRQPLPARLRAQMAVGYPRGSEPGRPYEFVGPAPAGSLSSTGNDMARFMIAHLAQGRGLMAPRTAAVMHNSPLDRVNPRSLIPPLNRMELGFFETNINDREVIGHLGDTQLFHTSLHLFIDDGVGLYVSFNSRGKDSAVGALRTALFEDFADRYFPAPNRDGRVDAATARRHAELMAGNWELSLRSQSDFLALFGLLGQTNVGVGANGELVAGGLTDQSGAARHWVEIAPFVWRERDGHERLAAQVVDGKVVRWSWGLLAPFMVYDRVPTSRSSIWILPLLYASLGILLLTFLHWPLNWAVRRRHNVPLELGGRAMLAYRGVRLAAGLTLAILIGWVLAVTSILTDSASGAGSDGFLWFLQVAGLLVFVGLVLASAWNLRQAWAERRRWYGKLWAVLVFLASLLLLYVAWGFGLVAMTVNY